ncbi:hypothetical protein FOXYSP1_07948 [Fusarium oxysporum f. sp. phaseoli]
MVTRWFEPKMASKTRPWAAIARQSITSHGHSSFRAVELS